MVPEFKSADIFDLKCVLCDFILQQTVFSGIKLTFTCSHNSVRRASKSSCSEEAGERDDWLRFTSTYHLPLKHKGVTKR